MEQGMYGHTKAILVACIFLSAATAFASPPESHRDVKSGPGSEFVPVAGYHRTVQLLRLRRRLQPLAAHLAPGVNLSLSGRRSIPVICVEFEDVAHDFPTGKYQSNLFDPPGPQPIPPRRTLTQYYRDISNGRFVPTGKVMGWYKLPEEDSFYEGANNGLNENLAALLKHAFTKADADTDFGDFDNDGPDGLPNSGDDDGIVDTVFIIHPETGGECGNSNLWSHSFSYQKFYSTNGAFETSDVRRDASGDPVLNDDGSEAKIVIDDYTLQPGLACPSSDDEEGGAKVIPIGVFCHEYGHALGLPDLYDRTDDDSEGVGNFCLMAGGSYGANGKQAATPVHMSAWCKALLGWATIQNVTTNGPVILEPVQERNFIYNIDVPGTDGKEFFLVEYRDSGWADSFDEKINWDEGFDPGGIAIWHVDERVGESSPEWPFTEPGEGQNDHPSLPGSVLPSFRPSHSLVSLIQRDKKLHLERAKNRGDAGDLFGHGHSFGDDKQCRGGSRAYSGKATGISLNGIVVTPSLRQANVRLDDFPAGEIPQLAVNPVPASSPHPGIRAAIAAPGVPRIATLTRIRQVGAHILRDGMGSLSENEKAVISGATVQDLQQGVSSRGLKAVLQLATKQRTKSIRKSDVAESAVEKNVSALLKPDQTAKFRVAPGGKRVESIVGLDLENNGRSPDEEIKFRLRGELKDLIGDGIKLEPQPAANPATPIMYSQVVEVAGQKVPLHCNGVRFFFKSGHLTAMQSNVIPAAGLQITGVPNSLPSNEAKQIVSERLKLPASLLQETRQCVYLPGGDPSKARIAVQVNVDVGKHKQLKVLVDSASKTILEIE